uniref:Uncharacterized protein n=1 Tax=Rhizophora mucronata TaxID=61149 RepID=A0A2P2J249_RHIMU
MSFNMHLWLHRLSPALLMDCSLFFCTKTVQ